MQNKKKQNSVFLTRVRPGDFSSCWSDVRAPSVLHACQENRLWMRTNEMTQASQWNVQWRYAAALVIDLGKMGGSNFYHAASLPVQMDLGHVHQESEHHPPESDIKWSDYVIDWNIFIFRPVISGWKLLLLSSWVGSQLGSQNTNPQSQISCN